LGSQALANPQNTFFNVKQVLGKTSVSDVSAFNMNSNLPYMIDKSDVGNKVLIKSVQGDNIRLFAPEEVIGAILHRIKTGAEKHLHARVTDAVISVPAAFNCVRRQAILDAAKMAGLNVMGLINEPTAALLGHGFPKRAGEVSYFVLTKLKFRF
jgi:molecular chaperone DnaK (HSP70)